MNEEQKNRAIQIWNKYQDEGEHFLNASQEFTREQLHEQRFEVIPVVLAVLQEYLAGKMELDEFKTQIDSINKRHRLWGFKGINGQMFFNLLVKTCYAGDKIAELDAILKKSLPLPASPEQSSKIIEDFAKFTKSISQYVNDLRGAPKIGSIPFFLSYFWQIQSPQMYPVYYRSMITILLEYNLWTPADKISESYLSFYQLNHELRELFSRVSGRNLSLWDVEHAFWYMNQPEPLPGPQQPTITVGKPPEEKKIFQTELPDSYIPPVAVSYTHLTLPTIYSV